VGEPRPGCLIRRELEAGLAAGIDERTNVPPVLGPRVIAVIVTDAGVRIDGVDQRPVERQPVGGPDMSGTLARAVQKVGQDLVCDKETQQGR
jgi:hypothetical protein